MAVVPSLFGILSVLFVGVISPGPSFLLVAQTAVSQSRKSALASALGMALGATFLCILALFGLQAMLQQFPRAYFAIRMIGAIYLLVLAVRLWRRSSAPIEETDRIRTQRPLFQQFAMAFGVMVTNPKAAVQYGVIFATFLPQHPSRELSILLPVCVFLMEAGWYSFVAFALSSPRTRSSYVGAKKYIDRIAGALLGGMSIRLLLSK